ncbi:hypothetical protein Veis_3833 [Verminephrobacter eiseniae EF01-2]|uniref:Uncharacterized protein n=1 Tax=Verminephrobacter eiseniae (strain EF01-2) TaxID=391735 RepID=A1WPI5_VEREI|nr:hypothetical protein Veis_3833 [Verminephrobacter eiseniae EF01-2]
MPLQAFDPATGSLPRPTATGGLADADRVVAAAHAAQPVGENLPAAQRAAAIDGARGIGELLRHRAVQMPVARTVADKVAA